MNEVGPVERSLDKGMTSGRLLDKMREEGVGEKAYFEKEEEENRERRRRRWNGPKEAILAEEEKEEEEEEKGFSGEELAEFLAGVMDFEKMEVDDEKMEGLREKMEGLRETIGVPVILVDDDEDKSLIGAWEHKVEEFKASGMTSYVADDMTPPP